MQTDLKTWNKAHPRGQPLELVLVSSGTEFTAFEIGLRNVVVRDPEFKLGSIFGANGTPMAVLIDSEGRVAAGPVAGRDACLELLQPRRPTAAVDWAAEVV